MLAAVYAVEFHEGQLQRLAGPLDGGIRIAVRATDRLGDDRVDDAELQQVLGGDFHIGGRVLGLRAVVPQDRGGTSLAKSRCR